MAGATLHASVLNRTRDASDFANASAVHIVGVEWPEEDLTDAPLLAFLGLSCFVVTFINSTLEVRAFFRPRLISEMDSVPLKKRESKISDI